VPEGREGSRSTVEEGGGGGFANDDLMAEAIVVFETFVSDVSYGGNNSKGWKYKKKRVIELETYFRESLAVDKSFSFLDWSSTKQKKPLSHCKIRWKVGGEFTEIKWPKLLIGHGKGRGDSLREFRKCRISFVNMLNRIVDELGGW
jgi:hypothetical protein